jgi:ornithine cyclodeaminase/alanine dehydrogenase-like protein (mu-crystallin family)
MRLLDAGATAAGLPFPALIEALRRAFREGVDAPERHHHALPGGATLLLMPAWQREWMGVKIVTVHPGNAARGMQAVHGTYLLSDVRTGVPVALLDGDVLTARRTAAASALAASYLARPDASRLLVVGAGRVGSLMAEAHSAVRPIREITVWNPTPARGQLLIERLRAKGFSAQLVTELEAAVGAADIVSCATLARAPIVMGRWLRAGTHLDLVGAFRPEMREADAEAVGRASVFVDTEAALHEAGELAGVSEVCGTLAGLCRGEVVGRSAADEVTLFKSTGTALEDLAAAMLAAG